MNKQTPLVIALIAIVSLVASSAAVASPKPACAETCAVALEAGPIPKTWRSPQRFGQVTLELGVFAGFGESSLRRRLKDRGCTGIYTGRGLRITVKVCGKGAVPIRVTAVAEQPGTIFTVAYQAS